MFVSDRRIAPAGARRADCWIDRILSTTGLAAVMHP
jgi:hypothetical protein